MKHEIKLEKIFAFPNGLISAIVAEGATILFINHIGDFEWWINLLLCAVFFVIYVLLILFLNFFYCKQKDGKNHVYIMIEGEDIEEEKFVDDIRKSFEEHNNNETKFIVPRYLQRKTFNTIVKWVGNRKPFWETKYFEYFQKRTNPIAVLYGSIGKRKENGGKYYIKTNVIYRCNANLDDPLNKFIVKQVSQAFLPNILVSQEKEVSGFLMVQQYFEDVMEFIVGLSKFALGKFEEAYCLHKKLYSKKTNTLLTKKTNFKLVLAQEVNILYWSYIYRKEYIKADTIVSFWETIYGKDAKSMKTQLLMFRTTNEQEMIANARKCASMLKTESGKPDFLCSKAYVCLILGNFKISERLYNSFFKMARKESEETFKIQQTIESLIHYCAIAKGKEFERPYALFLEGQIQFKYYKNYEKAEQNFKELIHMGQNNTYLKDKAKKFIDKIDEKKNKKR